ncbi:MAG: hypothetical protein E6Z13_08655, partial [Dermabacter sp.]|nr:hypothetical protein [Dermabacter sp.]
DCPAPVNSRFVPLASFQVVIFSHLTCDIEGVNTVFHHFEKRGREQARKKRKGSWWGRGKGEEGGGVRRENGE